LQGFRGFLHQAFLSPANIKFFMNKVHFIAIGGAVMHNLALALKSKGFEVSGSDDEIYEPALSRLRTAGVLPAQNGWDQEKIHSGLDAVILGMHARKDNPELLRAQELGIKVYSFPEYVFEQSKEKTRVVIAGSHGKTSITSMILHVLAYHKRDFDYLVGAQIDGFDLMVRLTHQAPLIIIEGDEYLASPLDMRSKFLFYKPHIALISGVAWDHFNVFPKYEDYFGTFMKLCETLERPGVLLYDVTDPEADKIGSMQREGVESIPYKAYPYEVEDGKAYALTPEGKLKLEVFGEHNMKNLNGARIICEKLGIDEAAFFEALRTFKGAAKRLETLAQTDDTHIFRDFAHAPSKVGATTKAVKELYGERPLVAAYELHTFSSLNKDFLPHYAEKLKDADTAIVFYSPHTLEMKRMPALSEDEVRVFFQREDLLVFTETAGLEKYLKCQSWKNKNLLLMSSGTFGGMDFKGLAEKLVASPVQP
jgi:UDP-N-acetylmuramate: L-alanyl-gamma-D-glutamyl-meso-diaminopimelate ligase